MRAKKKVMVGVVLTGGCELQTPQRHGALTAYQLLAQANNVEYGKLQKIAKRMGIEPAELANWGAGLLAEAQTRGMSKPTDMVLAASMAEAAQLAGRNTLTAEQINRLRSTANQFFRHTEQQARRDLVAQDSSNSHRQGFLQTEGQLFKRYATQHVPQKIKNEIQPVRDAWSNIVNLTGLTPEQKLNTVREIATTSVGELRDRWNQFKGGVAGLPGNVGAAVQQLKLEARIFSALPNESKLYVTQSMLAEAYHAYWARYKNPGDEKVAEEAAERAAQRALEKEQNPNPLDESKIAQSAAQLGNLFIGATVKIPLKVGMAVIKYGLPPLASYTLLQLTTGNFRVMTVLDSRNLPLMARENFNIESGIPVTLIETGIKGGPRSVLMAAWNPGKEGKLFLPVPSRPNEAWAPPYAVSSQYGTSLNLGAGYLAPTGGIVPSSVRLGYYSGNNTNLGIGAQVRVVGPRILANPASGYLLNQPEDGRSLKVGGFAVLNLLPQIQGNAFLNLGPIRIVNSAITNQASGGSASVHSGAPETGWRGVTGTIGNQVSLNAGDLPGGGNYVSHIGMVQLNSGFDQKAWNTWLDDILRKNPPAAESQGKP